MIWVFWMWASGAVIMAAVLWRARMHPEAPPIPPEKRWGVALFCLVLCVFWFVGPLAVLLGRRLKL
jgi:hypothetical protein